MERNKKIREGFKKVIECKEAAQARVYTPVRGPTSNKNQDTKSNYKKR